MAKLTLAALAAIAVTGFALADETNNTVNATAEMSGSTPGSTIIVELPEARKFSVKRVAEHIRALGYTKVVREALIEADAYEMYVGANYLKEDDPAFLAMKSVIQQITGMSGDQLEEILADCLWEE